MAELEKVINELKDGLDFKIYDNTCVLLTVTTASNALELLKDQKNLIDGLIEDQLKKDGEQQAEIERLKSLVRKKNRKIKKLMEDNYLNGGR